MKKSLFSAVVLCLCMAAWASAAPRGDKFVARTSANHGDTISALYVSCSSTAWTALLPANTIRRVAVLETLANTAAVCISTVAAVDASSNTLCTATLPGYRLVAPTAAPGVYHHYSEAAVNCRALDAQSAIAVYGLEYKDSRDNTSAE